ncbi:MAG: hypothetical protein CL878_03805 [Dehalococcoidia bacterium]|nr:hypothetical protein [Dehalococcoidia bacterium]
MLTLDDMIRDPYAALGVRKVINATSHTTRVGGTLLPREVLDTMRAAAEWYVDMEELQRAAGRVIAHYTHAESGYIVSGCAAALLVGTAAIITGTDPVKMQQLPHLAGTGMKDRVIARRFPRRKAPDGREYIHYGYAHALKTTGVQFDEIGNGRTVSREELDAAFGPQTALVYWGTESPPGELTVKDVAEVANAHDVPVLVDNSNHLPPKENLWRYIEDGAALVAFSGGKGLQGPQGSGILAGRGDLMEAVAMQASPTQGIGRVCKVSKEEVVAQVAALIWWAEQDDETRLAEHGRKTQKLVDLAQGLKGAQAKFRFPDRIGRPFASMYLSVQPASGHTMDGVIEQLRDGEPPVAVKGGDDPSDPTAIRFDVRVCADWEIEAIGKRLHEILGS